MVRAGSEPARTVNQQDTMGNEFETCISQIADLGSSDLSVKLPQRARMLSRTIANC